MQAKTLIAEFLAHIIVSDKQIHSNEMRILEEYFSENKLTPEEKESIFKILGATDDHKSCNETLNNLKEFSAEEIQSLKQWMTKIITCDTHIDDAEYDLIKKAAQAFNWDLKELKIIQKEYYNNSLSIIENYRVQYKPVDNWKRFRIQIKAAFATGEKKSQLKKEIRRMTLTGPEYTKAIQDSAKIAEADAMFLENIVISNVHKNTEIITSIKNIIASNENSNHNKELIDSLNEFYKFIKDDVQIAMEENKAILNAKKRAMNFFSISFLGRTKAGKSTLHYVLTDEGKDFIGKGLERTTRYNRVYEWENLRIIDTPGIGAAESSGRNDEEIALSIVDESDIICYVVTDDSIQATEFSFLKKLRDKNKPVIILLNNKKNIKPLPFYKKFINDPHEWYNSKDTETNNRTKIGGHINRITQYVNEYYDSKYIKIIPVHLLAAKMSKLQEFEKDSDILFEGSHLNEFLDYLREEILNSSSIRRTQTIIDGSCNSFNNILLRAKEYLNKLEALNVKIEKKQTDLNKKIEKSKVDIKIRITRNIKSLFDELRNFAADFSETYYDAGDGLNLLWNDACKKEFCIDQKLQDAMKRPLIALAEDVNDNLSDITTDLGTFISSTFANVNSGGDTFNTKRLISGLSIGIGAVGLFMASNPIGWVLIGLSVVFQIISGLFKSRAKKIAEAKEKVRKSLYTSLDKQKSNYLDSISDYTEENTKIIHKEVNITLNILRKTLCDSITIASNFVKTIESDLNILDCYFAQRIIDYLTNNERSDISNIYGKEISVDRIHGKSFSIKTNKIISQKDIQKIMDILQNNNILITK